MKFSKLLATSVTGLSMICVMSHASATNLLTVYHQAQRHDPTFQKAEADWHVARENFPIALASYLPLFSATADWQRNYSKLSIRNARPSPTNGYNWSSGYSLSLTQPIFDAAAWYNIRQASASVKSATATYAAASQDLMVRTTQAYFAVLQAADRLRFTQSNKRAVLRQLKTAQQQFKVGLIAITNVYDAQSAYDQAMANEISDRNALSDRLEELRAITGSYYHALSGINVRIPLIKPVPSNINAWVHVAEDQNYTLRAQDYSVLAAHANIGEQNAGHLPTLDAVGSYSDDYNWHYTGGAATRLSKAGSLGLQLTFPIYSGGSVSALTRQARYQYLSASSLLDFTHRDTVRKTRQSYLGVMSGISQIRADHQAIVSANNALKATEAGYVVGTRTMVDVLNDLSTLYGAQQTYADDQYRYINSTVALKESAGTLNVMDLQHINGWLKKKITLDLPRAAFGSSKKYTTPKVILSKPSKQSSRKTTRRIPKPRSKYVTQRRYTIQLYASSHKTAALRFIQRQPIRATLRLSFHKPWYVVVTGSYNSRAQATRAIQKLPASLKRLQPWVTRSRVRVSVVVPPASPAKKVVTAMLPHPIKTEAKTTSHSLLTPLKADTRILILTPRKAAMTVLSAATPHQGNLPQPARST